MPCTSVIIPHNRAQLSNSVSLETKIWDGNVVLELLLQSSAKARQEATGLHRSSPPAGPRRNSMTSSEVVGLLTSQGSSTFLYSLRLQRSVTCGGRPG